MDPQPNIYAALPPSQEKVRQLSIDIAVASIAFSTWDWILSISEECEMIQQRKGIVPKFVYFISRTSMLLYMIFTLYFEVSSPASCEVIMYAIGVAYAIAVPSTTAIFFMRICVVYRRYNVVLTIFTLLWLLTLGAALYIPFGIKAEQASMNERCLQITTTAYAPISSISITLFDTLVFLAISWRLTSFGTLEDTFRDRIRAFLIGDGLLRLSSSLIHDGKLYYCMTIGFNVLTVAMLLHPNIPQGYHLMFVPANMAMESVMACRLVRGIKLGAIREWQPEMSLQVQSTSIALDPIPRA